jgi:hypothetical protein
MSMIDFDDIAQHFSTGPEATQTKRSRAFVQIMVAGKDVTSKLNPYLMSVMVRDSSALEVDIELDDRDARLDIPPFNSTLQVSMGWTSESMWRVFTGNVVDVEHRFGRKQGGRRMHVHGLGADPSTAVKNPQQGHVGDGAGPGQSQGKQVMFSDAAKQFAGNIGLTASVGATYLSLGRDYWSINNESVMQWFSRHADELGAKWRIEGTNVVFNHVNDFDKPLITARWGDNLLTWVIRPYVARSSWSGGIQRYFEDRTGKWLDVVKKFGLSIPWSGAKSTFALPVPAPNAQIAGQQNIGSADKAYWGSGDGRLIINGEPKAAWNGQVRVIGARPGVDGLYRIFSANHSWSRQGFVTTLEVFPEAGAGVTTQDSIGAQGYGPPAPTAPDETPTTFQERFDSAPASFQDRFGPATVTSQVANADGSTTTFFSDGTIATANGQGTTTLSPNGDEAFTPATPAAPVGAQQSP